MIIDFFDAIDTMLTALFVWIIIGSAAATLLVLGAAALVWSAWKRASRGARGPCGASDVPDDAPDPHDAPEPPHARIADPSYEEAA